MRKQRSKDVSISREFLLMIIKGGLEGNKRKVRAYAYLIAANLKEDGITEEEIFEILKKEGMGNYE